MGLDIYLYTREEEQANNEHERLWEEAFNATHDEETGELKEGKTEEDWKAASATVPPYQGHANPKSEKYPDHLFNRRYLRSSYNGGGFNRAVPDMLGRQDVGLYEIFEPVIGDDPEPYNTTLTDEHIPALEQCGQRALEVANELRASDPLRSMSVMTTLGSAEHLWHQLPSEDEALAWYREEVARKKLEPDKEEYGYSTAKGEVFGFIKGLEVLACTLGRNPLAGFSQQFPPNTVGASIGVLPEPILIYRMHDEGKLSYIQSAEIIAEFCEEAIMLVKQDGGCSHTCPAGTHWEGGCCQSGGGC